MRACSSGGLFEGICTPQPFGLQLPATAAQLHKFVYEIFAMSQLAAGSPGTTIFRVERLEVALTSPMYIVLISAGVIVRGMHFPLAQFVPVPRFKSSCGEVALSLGFILWHEADSAHEFWRIGMTSLLKDGVLVMPTYETHVPLQVGTGSILLLQAAAPSAMVSKKGNENLFTITS